MSATERWSAECPRCGGRGVIMILPGDVDACPRCEGEGDVEVVPFTKHQGAVAALAKADGEVAALADALRAAGVAPTTVQAIIDHATPRGR